MSLNINMSESGTFRCFWLKTAHKKHRVKLRVPFIYDEWKKLLKTLFNGEPAYIIVTDGLIIGLDCLHTEKENDEQHAYEVVLAEDTTLTPNLKQTVSRLVEAFNKIHWDSSDAGPQTNSEWYTEHGGNTSPFWFEATVDSGIGSKFSQWNLNSAASETQDVQPLWTDFIARELNNQPNATVRLVSSPNTPTISTHKPDIPGYMRNSANNEYYLLVAGELKGGRVRDEFSSEEKGQMGGFLAKLLKLTQRRFCFGFITDNRLIQFFRGEQVDNGFIMTESPIELMSRQGWRQLITLLSQELPALGLEYTTDLIVAGKPVIINQYLGRGAFSVVYKGTYDNKEVVVKYFKNGNERLVVKEVTNLQQVQVLHPSVPQVIGTADNNALVLVMDTVGLPFGRNVKHTSLTCSHICDLIDTLEAVHKHFLIHRDIKISNFFARQDDHSKILLNDWSLAALMTSEVTVAGTMVYKPSRLLQQLPTFKYHPKPSDDLESVVKDVQHHWEEVFRVPFWSNFLNRALHEDYKGMKIIIEGFFL